MKKTISQFFSVTFLAFLLSNCVLSISKPLVKEIEFLNHADEEILINNKDSKITISIQHKDKKTLELVSPFIVEILFSDQSKLEEYDLSDLDLKVSANREKSGKRFTGKIYWVYSCTITTNRTLIFSWENDKGKLEEVLVGPVTEID